MSDFYFISVFLHILSAAIWIGGMIFLALVLLPGLNNHPDKALLIHGIGIRFRTVGWLVLLLLLVTGLYCMHVRNIPFSLSELRESRYGIKLLYKLIIFTITVLLSAAHDFYIGTTATRLWMKSTNPEKVKIFRAWARWAGRVNLVLALIAAGIGVAFVRGL